jgi:2-phospho-L-lactate guanylyltransferase
MSLWAIVPVKPLRRGKSRLSGVLSEEERTFLNFNMLASTLRTLAQVKEIDSVLVISRDPGALALARDFNARTVHEDSNSDLNIAIKRATVVALFYGVESLLILPADLPLLTPEAVGTLIQHKHNPPVMVIAPDRRKDGTNALLTNPAGLIDYSYGPGSFEKHVEQARRYHSRVEVCDIPEIALDLDIPEDLDLLREMESVPIGL